MIRFHKGILLVLVLVFGCALAQAGSLQPWTAGPTQAIPVQSLPLQSGYSCPTASYCITAAGTYYLAGDIVGQTGMDGISISASDVTLDLMGFTLNGRFVQGVGIKASGSVANVTVKNGATVNWGYSGIDFAAATRSLLLNIRSENNTYNGIVLNNGQVMQCHVSGGTQSGWGISVTSGEVTECSVSRTRDHAIGISDKGRVVANVIYLSDSGDAGIVVYGDKNYIDGNLIVGAKRGITVPASDKRNLITRNNVTGPTSLALAFENFGTVNPPAFGALVDAHTGGVIGAVSPLANVWY